MENSYILKHFDKESYRSKALFCEIRTATFYRPHVNSGFGDTPFLTEARTHRYLRFSLRTVPPGLPFFQLSSAVFFRNLFLFPFRILGLAKKRLRFRVREIDRALDLFCREKQATRTELPWLFSQDFLKELGVLVQEGFKGDFTYDGATLSYETRVLPENEKQLKKIEQAVDFMLKMSKRLEKSQRHPVLSVRRMARLMKNEKVLDKVSWDSKPGSLPHPSYPHELSAFFSVLGQVFWSDPRYTDKPVETWLKNPSILETLPLEDVKAVCTYLTRQERFCDGFWEHAFKAGYVDALLRNPVLK